MDIDPTEPTYNGHLLIRHEHRAIAGVAGVWDGVLDIWNNPPLPTFQDHDFPRGVCRKCGEPIATTGKRGRPAQYCGDDCRTAGESAYQRRYRAHRARVELEKIERVGEIYRLLNRDLVPVIRRAVEPEFRGWHVPDERDRIRELREWLHLPDEISADEAGDCPAIQPASVFYDPKDPFYDPDAPHMIPDWDDDHPHEKERRRRNARDWNAAGDRNGPVITSTGVAILRRDDPHSLRLRYLLSRDHRCAIPAPAGVGPLWELNYSDIERGYMWRERAAS
jgi:hypothetical protein